MTKTNSKAICFDLGESLIGYDGTPLNWKAHYPQALREVCSAFGRDLGQEAERKATQTLLRYNTRETPRLKETDHDTVFGEIGVHLGLQNQPTFDL
jgi:putative hydrolase of the HAD superfamily